MGEGEGSAWEGEGFLGVYVAERKPQGGVGIQTCRWDAGRLTVPPCSLGMPLRISCSCALPQGQSRS